MNEKFEKMKNGKGFIAALDQSGGSTPKALKLYGINENEYFLIFLNCLNLYQKRLLKYQ